MQVTNSFTKSLNLNFPLIMAPMFLVSNEEMVKEAIKGGVMGTFPTLNYRKEGELEQLLDTLNEFKKGFPIGNYGVNLIGQKTNILYKKHLDICIEKKVPFFITSLGNPEDVIERGHKYGAKVYCDVTNTKHAKKVFDAGCDGFIAVGQGAGGHAGPYPLQVLVPSLKKHFPNMPIIAAGGIATGAGVLSVLALGAEGASVGTRFIASKEAKVSNEYKNAIVDSEMGNIVMTDKISGTPCTIIDTPYARKIGLKQNWLEKKLSTSPRTKKYFKMLIQFRSLKRLEKAVLPANYNSLWCAGQSVELIDNILPSSEIIHNLRSEFELAYRNNLPIS